MEAPAETVDAPADEPEAPALDVADVARVEAGLLRETLLRDGAVPISALLARPGG